jgi:hypothetical protein
MPEPATKIQSEDISSAQPNKNNRNGAWIFTQKEDRSKDQLSDTPEHDPAGVVNTVHLRMASLEFTDDVVGL